MKKVCVEQSAKIVTKMWLGVVWRILVEAYLRVLGTIFLTGASDMCKRDHI